jgi:hypothetical protein
VSLEDIAPFSAQSTSIGANTLTVGPQQVYQKKRGREGALASISTKELTREERKRIRGARKSIKKKQNEIKKEKVRLAASVDSTSKERHYLDAVKTHKIVSGDKRVSLGKTSDTNHYTKSGEFFNQLQSQIRQDIRIKSANISNKHSDETTSSLQSNIFKL